MSANDLIEHGKRLRTAEICRDLGRGFPRLAEIIHDLYSPRDRECADIGGSERAVVESMASMATRQLKGAK